MEAAEKIYVPEEYIKLAKVNGISVESGLEYCGNWRSFDKFLDSFYEDIPEKSAEIEDAYINGDIPFFTIKVHALKTTARIIGAKELSEQAEALEMAGKSENQDFIEDHVFNLLELLRSYDGKLSEYMIEKHSNCEPKKPITAAELEDAYMSLREVAACMDYDSVEMILEALDEYDLPPADVTKTNKINFYLKKLKWDELIEFLNK